MAVGRIDGLHDGNPVCASKPCDDARISTPLHIVVP